MGDGRVGPFVEGVTEAAEDEGRAKRVPAGALLMSFKLTIGRVGFASEDVFPNEAIVWVKPRDEHIDERYLAAYLEAFDYSGLTGRAAKGATLNSKSLKAIPVQLPDRDTQRHVAHVVGVLDRTVLAARRHEAAAQALAEALLEVELDDPDFQTEQLGTVLRDIDGGRSPRCADRPPVNGEWGVLKTTAVRPNIFVATEAKTLEDETLLHRPAQVRKGDLLVLRASGNRKRVGHACVVDCEPSRLLLSDLIYRLALTGDADPNFISLALSSVRLRAQIEGRAVGSSTMRKLNHGLLRALDVPLAGVERQRLVVEKLRPALAVARSAGVATDNLVHTRSAVIRALLDDVRGAAS